MKNTTMWFSDQFFDKEQEAYESLTNAECIYIKTIWWNTDSCKVHVDIDKLDGIELELDEEDIHELIYGENSISDNILAFEGVASASVYSFEEEWEEFCEDNDESWDDYPELSYVELILCTEKGEILHEDYPLNEVYRDYINEC